MLPPAASRIAVGIIRRAHCVRGEVSVEPWTDSVDRFRELHSVTLVSPDEADMLAAEIESSREHGGRALVKFIAIDSPEATRALHGWTIETRGSSPRTSTSCTTLSDLLSSIVRETTVAS
jgi:ribosomal 30S subunit maturation factor RimM